MIKLSVIIPVYNVEKYLDECLNSLLNQTIINEMEIICINDGSTDDSLKIINNYTKRIPNFKIINQINMGQSSARNRGLIEAKGEYISFLDSDDYILGDNYFEIIYKKAKDFNLDILSFNHFIYNNGSFYKKIIKRKECLYTGKSYILENFGRKLFTMIVDKVYKKSYLDSFDFCFVQDIFHEDDEAFIRLFYNAKKVSHINLFGYVYRQREGSTINQEKNYKHMNGYIETSKTIAKYFILEKEENFKKYLKSKLYEYLMVIYFYGRNIKNNEYIFNFYENYKSIYFNNFFDKVFFQCDELYLKNRKKLSLEYCIRKIRRLYYGN